MGDWSQMSPETAAWMRDSILQMADTVRGYVNQYYLQGSYSHLFPEGSQEALTHLTNSLKNWFIGSKTKAEQIMEQYPGFDDFPGFGGDGGFEDDNSDWWSEVISRPPTWSGNVKKAVTGLASMTMNFVHAIYAPRLRQYWDLYYSGYISKSELLAFSGCRDMMHFFEYAGADPNFATPLRTQRENRQLTDAQLVQRMGLDNIDQVNKVLGLDWRLALDMREQMMFDGFNISMNDAKAITTAYFQDLQNLNVADASILEGMTQKMQQLGFNNAPAEYRSFLIEETVDAILAVPENTATASTNEAQAVLVSTNAFVDATGEESSQDRKKAFAATEDVNSDLIQSNIAFAMRQMDGNKGSSDSFYSDYRELSSFASLSFASPFENKNSLGNGSGKVA